jgi:hypothetical protein
MVVTDLPAVDETNGRSPRQLKDDAALTFKWVEFDLVFAGPVVFVRGTEDRAFVRRVRVFERELADTVPGQSGDVVPDGTDGIDVSAGHDTGGPHFESRGGPKESVERRRTRSHQTAARIVVMMVSGIAEVGEAGIAEAACQVMRQKCAVGEAGDFVKEGGTALD